MGLVSDSGARSVIFSEQGENNNSGYNSVQSFKVLDWKSELVCSRIKDKIFCGKMGKEVMKEDRIWRGEYAGKNIGFSIKNKILLLAAAVALPFLVLLVYLLVSMSSYSNTYDKIVSNLTIANNYNISFKEEMDESLYKLVVGYVTFENISQEETIKDPYVLIDDLRSTFTDLMGITTEEESRMWLESLLRNINTLEKRVDDIVESVAEGGQYDKNIKELDNNIYILTELIREDIQYYIYYQTRSMEQVNNNLNAKINKFIVVCSVLIGAVLLVVIILTLLIVSGILKPVQELTSATRKVSKGDFQTRAPIRSRDEIAVLAEAFNNMAGNMQSLVDKIKEDERKMRKADLRLLQEQINPHFLYNTLDTIVWLIEAEETDKAVNMVVTLSEFFRLVLSRGKEFITVREEEQHISSYLEIQEVRYHDILEYDVQIDQSLYEFEIPKLTLQPLVENALYHGIKYKRAKGYIHVNGERDGDTIRLTVRDNGVGMDEEELQELRKEISRPCKETEKGFGLANVNERIHMYFGPEYGMTITSRKGKGTIVEVVIPIVQEKKMWKTDTQKEEDKEDTAR